MGVGMQINGYLSVNTTKCENLEKHNLQCMRLVTMELFHIIIEMCYLSQEKTFLINIMTQHDKFSSIWQCNNCYFHARCAVTLENKSKIGT